VRRHILEVQRQNEDHKEKTMKKRTIILLLVLAPALAFAITEIMPVNTAGLRVDPGTLHTIRADWVQLDATTSAGTEPSDLAAGERTYSTLATAIAAGLNGDDEISTFSLYSGSARQRLDWNRIRFRCIGITNGQSITYQIYLGDLGSSGATECALVKVAQLAFTIGQQVSEVSTYEFADAVAVTEYCWPKAIGYSSPGDTTDLVAEAYMDLMGSDYIVAVPTTAGCDCQLLIKGY
jgi:hypothetical protein